MTARHEAPEGAMPTEDHIRRMLRAVAGNAVDAARLLRGRQHRAPADDDTCDAVLALLLGVQAEDPQCFLLATPQLLKDAPANGVATIALAAFEQAVKAPEPKKLSGKPIPIGGGPMIAPPLGGLTASQREAGMMEFSQQKEVA